MEIEPLSLFWSAQAKADLAEVYRYVAQSQSELRAEKIADAIRTAIFKIPSRPYLYPKDPTPNPLNENRRRMIVGGKYHVPYAIDAKEIIVLRVFHVARNPSELHDDSVN